MWVLVPQLPIANSTLWVLPSTIMPALTILLTTSPCGV